MIFSGSRAVVALCFAVLSGFAQEINPKDPAVISDGVNRSTAVVIGTFKTGLHFPWFDGWHYVGRIDVEEVLYGGDTLKSGVALRWKERHGTCLICEKKSAFDGEKGIWFLARINGQWQLAETKLWCGGPLGMDVKNDVLQAVRRKK